MWAYKNFAYVGTWSGPCPGTGVKIIDLSDPAHPRQVATAAGYPNTSAEDMQVISVRTPSFTGDLLGVGLQDCGLPDQAPGLTGLDLWDVTDPAHPTHLGFHDVGPSGGVHELSLTKRTMAGQDRVFALAAVPFAEVFSTAFTPTPRGDFQLIDVTDPHHPTIADDWGAGKDGGQPFGGDVLRRLRLPGALRLHPASRAGTDLPREFRRSLRAQRHPERRRQDRLRRLLGRRRDRPRPHQPQRHPDDRPNHLPGRQRGRHR